MNAAPNFLFITQYLDFPASVKTGDSLKTGERLSGLQVSSFKYALFCWCSKVHFLTDGTFFLRVAAAP